MSYELDSHIQENTYGLDSFRKPVKQDHLTNPVGNYLFFDPHANCVVIRLFNRTEEEQDSTMNERVKTYSKEDFIHPW